MVTVLVHLCHMYIQYDIMYIHVHVHVHTYAYTHTIILLVLPGFSPSLFDMVCHVIAMLSFSECDAVEEELTRAVDAMMLAQQVSSVLVKAYIFRPHYIAFPSSTVFYLYTCSYMYVSRIMCMLSTCTCKPRALYQYKGPLHLTNMQ